MHSVKIEQTLPSRDGNNAVFDNYTLIKLYEQKETKQEVGVAGVSFGTFDEKPQGDMDLDEKELIPNLKSTQTLSASIEGRDVDGKSVLPFTASKALSAILLPKYPLPIASIRGFTAKAF